MDSKKFVFGPSCTTSSRMVYSGSHEGKSIYGSACNAFLESLKEVNDGNNIGVEEKRIKDFMEEKVGGSSTLFKQVVDYFLKNGILIQEKREKFNVYFLKKDQK